MFNFARKIGSKSTPFSSHVVLASFPASQQIRFYRPRLEERANPSSSPTVVPDKILDDLFYREEGGAAPEVVVCFLSFALSFFHFLCFIS